MTTVDNIGIVLYRFLRALSVKVSRSTVQRLLDTPVGSSMRGISDALDVLRIKNEVYQLPPSADCFAQLDAPFVTMQHTGQSPFCVVTKSDGLLVEFYDSAGKKRTMPTDKFLKRWVGSTLFAETTQETATERYRVWKDAQYCLLRYKVLIALLLSVVLALSSVCRQDVSPAVIAYLCTLAFGMLVSVALLYKELFDEHFMERFCHVGKVVDCNEVIHSKGAIIADVGLGEWSLLYFSVQFFYAALCPGGFQALATICNLAALGFTLYSVIYQLFILRKGCMLCMVVNLTVWISTCFLCQIGITFQLAWSETVLFLVVGSIGLAIALVAQEAGRDGKALRLLRRQMTSLFTPAVFQRLLSLEEKVGKPVEEGIALQSKAESAGQLLIVTNPNCKNCAKVHQAVKELAQTTPVSLLLLTAPRDLRGKRVAQLVLAAYQKEGWHKAMQLLEEWYKTKRINEADSYPVTARIEQIWEKQQEYCLEWNIDKTPAVIADGYYVPEIYSLSELQYVLT